MKSCDEWIKNILDERDRQLEIKRKKRQAMLRYSALAVCFCFTVILGNQVLRIMNAADRGELIRPTAPFSASETSDSTEEKSVMTTVTAKSTIYTENTSIPVSTSHKRDKTTETTALNNDGQPYTTASVSAIVLSTKTAVRTTAVSTKPSAVSVSSTRTASVTKLVTISESDHHSSTAVMTDSKPQITSSQCSSESKFTEMPEIAPLEPTAPITQIPDISYEPEIFQFSAFEYNGIKYKLTDMTAPPEDIDKRIDLIEIQGNDCTAEAELYKISGAPFTKAVAVKFGMSSKYYVYMT